MARMIRMAAKEIDKEFTPKEIKAMLAKARYSEDYNPYTHEEWWAKAERPNRGRPPKEIVKQDIHIRLDPFTLKNSRRTAEVGKQSYQLKLMSGSEWDCCN